MPWWKHCLDLLTALPAEQLLLPITSQAFICVQVLSMPGHSVFCEIWSGGKQRRKGWTLSMLHLLPKFQSLKQRSMLLTTLECTKGWVYQPSSSNSFIFSSKTASSYWEYTAWMRNSSQKPAKTRESTSWEAALPGTDNCGDFCSCWTHRSW